MEEPSVSSSISPFYGLDNSEKEEEVKGIDLNKGFSSDFSIESEIEYHNQELNLIDNFNADSSSTSSSTGKNDKEEESREHEEVDAEEEPRVFSCNYCQRKFYKSGQLLKRDRHLGEAAAAAFSYANMHHHLHNNNPYNHHQYQFSSMGSLPLYGSRSLGVQVHSMIHKPTSPSSSLPSLLPSSSFGNPQHHHHQHLYGQNHPGWTTSSSSSSFRPSIVDHQPTIGRLPSFVSGSMPRVPRFNNYEGGVGGSFLLQGGDGGGSGGGRSSTASNQGGGDFKSIDLALKL
ncbi:hypothetical protein MKW92_047145 [Papaver armeniacum]|nr:hypothetical protein MKW92_047145 [Papaver armeniacum]